MRAPVVVQDHGVWLLLGGPQLRVLSVSGAVRQQRAPDPAGHAVAALPTAATPRGLARQLGPAFAAGVAGKTRRLFRCCGGYRRRRPPPFPLSAPLVFTTTGAGFVSPSPYVCPSIANEAHNDVTSVQHGVWRLTFIVPTRRFFARFLKGASSPPPLCGGGGGTGGDYSPNSVSVVR